MTERIRKIYKKAGVAKAMPDGKGIHTATFHRCVVSYLKKGTSYKEAAKRCMGGLGRDVAVKKGHRRAPASKLKHGGKRSPTAGIPLRKQKGRRREGALAGAVRRSR